MATTMEARIRVTGTEDPRYKEGMAHLQGGQWHEALGCFEALAEQFPESPAIAQALKEARYKAELAGDTQVKERRWNIPWRAIASRVIMVIAVVAVAAGLLEARRRYMPVLVAARAEAARVKRLSDATALLARGDVDGAEVLYQRLLEEEPGHEEALKGLELVANQREVADAYQQALGYEAVGDYQAAIDSFTRVSILAPTYRDVGVRIMTNKRHQELESLLAEADADFEARQSQDALSKYRQIRETDESYQEVTVESRLFDLYLVLGHESLDQREAFAEAEQQALEYFSSALALRPRDAEAALQAKLLRLVIGGQNRFYQGAWKAAVTRLRQVYDERPGHLGEKGFGMLYEAYINLGDQYEHDGDLYLAYEQYLSALECGSQSTPPLDTTLAQGRLATLAPRLTPTPTATLTPLPTPTGLPTAAPTPRPLAAYRNSIVFLSDNEDQRGYWVMDSDGENRQYLGNNDKNLRDGYGALVEEGKQSPDGRHFLFVRDANPAQIFMHLPPHEQHGELPPMQLTRLGGICYDPVWSPEGWRIAFVSQESGSDDIWVINTDGRGARNITGNSWEWDKHPSWSPDGQRLVFWSNREGRKQIYTMDANGNNVRNISNTDWEEYDPIWIR